VQVVGADHHRPPQLRGTTDKFAARLFDTGVTRTHALVIASFVRGLSVRGVESALAGVGQADGERSLADAGLPMKITLMASSRKRNEASSRMTASSKPGWADKS